MSEELHPLVELLLARMESHPEEFTPELPHYDTTNKLYPVTDSRWETPINVIRSMGSDADKAALNKALSNLHMDDAHKWAIDELLNGEDRRRKQREAWEAEQAAKRVAIHNSQLQASQAYLQNQSYYDQLRNYPVGGQGLLGTGTVTAEQLEDEGIIKKLKKGLGI